jgi:WD40 repeat protein
MLKTCSLLSLLGVVISCGGGSGDPPPPVPTPDAGPPSDAPPDPLPPLGTAVSTLAGSSQRGAADGDRSAGRFWNPVNVLAAQDGTIYVADFDNSMIRVVDRSGNVSTLIKQAGFQRPFGLALAPNGTLYVGTDDDPKGGHSATSGTVWRVGVGARTATVLTPGLGRPRGLIVLADGRIAVADRMHQVVELIDPSTGAVTLLAGANDQAGYADGVGAAARFSGPYGIAVRADGKLLVTDNVNQRVRLIDVATGATSTFAGTGTAGYADGPLATATFNLPQSIAVHSSGDIYVTDTTNYRVRRIHGGVVNTVAGDGVAGYLDSDDRLAAKFFGLEGLAISRDGATVFVADGNRGTTEAYHRVRMIQLAP